ncbi:RecB family exonuclease [Thermovibrio sp.]
MVAGRSGLKVELSHLRPWSFTKVQKAKKCEYEFFFRYVEKLEPLERPDFFILGSGVHFVLENALNTAFEGGRAVSKELLKEFALRFKESEPLADLKKIELFFPNIIKFVNGQLRRVEKSSFVASEIELAVDSSLKLAPYASSSVYLRGKLDFIFSKGSILYIVDHKTSRSWDFNNKVKTQLRWYALLASIKFPQFERFALEVHNVRYGTINRFVFGKRELFAFKEKLLEKILEVENYYLGKDFDSLTPSPCELNCQWCEYRHLCPAVKKG